METHFTMEDKGVFVSEKSWLAKKSFPVVVFFFPFLVLYVGFLAVIPEDSLNTKPTPEQFVIGIISAVLGWIFLVVVFSFVWALLMRLIYGSDLVRRWLYEEQGSASGRLGSSIEKFMRRVCEYAL